MEEQHLRAGRLRTIASPIRFEKTPGTRRVGAPALGEHTDAVLGEAGFSAAELADLRATGVIV